MNSRGSAILKEFGHEQQRYNDDGRRGEESQILAAHDLASHRLGQRRHQMVGKQRCRARQFWRPMQPDFRARQRWHTVALRARPGRNSGPLWV
jgi:hypothetical protein